MTDAAPLGTVTPSGGAGTPPSPAPPVPGFVETLTVAPHLPALAARDRRTGRRPMVRSIRGAAGTCPRPPHGGGSP